MYTTIRQHIKKTKERRQEGGREGGRAGGIQFEISLRSAVFFLPFFSFMHTLCIEIEINENMGNANVGLKWNKKNWRHKRRVR